MSEERSPTLPAADCCTCLCFAAGGGSPVRYMPGRTPSASFDTGRLCMTCGQQLACRGEIMNANLSQDHQAASVTGLIMNAMNYFKYNQLSNICQKSLK